VLSDFTRKIVTGLYGFDIWGVRNERWKVGLQVKAGVDY
jgi:hypothetical protein